MQVVLDQENSIHGLDESNYMQTRRNKSSTHKHKHTQPHTHDISIYMYVYMYVYIRGKRGHGHCRVNNGHGLGWEGQQWVGTIKVGSQREKGWKGVAFTNPSYDNTPFIHILGICIFHCIWVLLHFIPFSLIFPFLCTIFVFNQKGNLSFIMWKFYGLQL